MQQRRVPCWLSLALLLWLAHALGYLVHEYAHSFTAWALGCKANPLALDYGHLSFQNVALLSDVDENVDYRPIFSAGKGYLASLVAVAGVLLGNGIFYAVSRAAYAVAKERGRRGVGLFAFLFCMMNVGNFWCYVPIRTFTTHADMATLASGLRISPWWTLAVLGIPFTAAILHFFTRLLPDARRFVLHDEAGPGVALMALSSFVVFAFFGSAGLVGYGEVSHRMSVFSACVLFPLALVLCWPRRTPHAAEL